MADKRRDGRAEALVAVLQDRPGHGAAEPEIRDLNAAVLGDEDDVRAKPAVRDAQAVRRLHRFGHGRGDRLDVPGIEDFRRMAHAQRRQRAAADAARDGDDTITVLEQFEGDDGARVFERPRLLDRGEAFVDLAPGEAGLGRKRPERHARIRLFVDRVPELAQGILGVELFHEESTGEKGSCSQFGVHGLEAGGS